MENKNTIRTFGDCKPSKKNTLNLIKVLLFLLKKTYEALDEFQDAQNINR